MTLHLDIRSEKYTLKELLLLTALKDCIYNLYSTPDTRDGNHKEFNSTFSYLSLSKLDVTMWLIHYKELTNSSRNETTLIPVCFLILLKEPAYKSHLFFSLNT